MTGSAGLRPAADESARLGAAAADAWDRYLAARPETATALGDRRFDERLRPNGPDAIATDVAWLTAAIRQAEAIDPARLLTADRLTRTALLDFLRFELDLIDSGLEAWAVDPLDGPQVVFLNVP